jgi:hypothetical protein
MKNIFLVMILLIGGILTAQNGRLPGGMPPGGKMPAKVMGPNGEKPEEVKRMTIDEMLAKMTTELQLDELQQLQVREILNDMEKKGGFNSSHSKGEKDNDFQAMKERVEAGKKDLAVKLSKILNEVQFKKWEKESESRNPKK